MGSDDQISGHRHRSRSNVRFVVVDIRSIRCRISFLRNGPFLRIGRLTLCFLFSFILSNGDELEFVGALSTLISNLVISLV